MPFPTICKVFFRSFNFQAPDTILAKLNTIIRSGAGIKTKKCNFFLHLNSGISWEWKFLHIEWCPMLNINYWNHKAKEIGIGIQMRYSIIFYGIYFTLSTIGMCFFNSSRWATENYFYYFFGIHKEQNSFPCIKCFVYLIFFCVEQSSSVRVPTSFWSACVIRWIWVSIRNSNVCNKDNIIQAMCDLPVADRMFQ